MFCFFLLVDFSVIFVYFVYLLIIMDVIAIVLQNPKQTATGPLFDGVQEIEENGAIVSPGNLTLISLSLSSKLVNSIPCMYHEKIQRTCVEEKVHAKTAHNPSPACAWNGFSFIIQKAYTYTCYCYFIIAVCQCCLCIFPSCFCDHNILVYLILSCTHIDRYIVRCMPFKMELAIIITQNQLRVLEFLVHVNILT